MSSPNIQQDKYVHEKNFYKCAQLDWYLHHLAWSDLATSWLALWMKNQDFCPTISRYYRWRQIVWLCPSAANEQPHFSLQIDGVGVNLHLWTRGDEDDVSEKYRHVYVSSSGSPYFAIDGIVVNSQFWPRGRKRRHLFKYTKKPTLARTPGIVKGNKSLRIKSFGLVEMRVTIMRNIETFPSKQMYPYLSLVERKVAEFYHNIDRRRWLVWLKWLIFINFFGQLMVSLPPPGPCWTIQKLSTSNCNFQMIKFVLCNSPVGDRRVRPPWPFIWSFQVLLASCTLHQYDSTIQPVFARSSCRCISSFSLDSLHTRSRSPSPSSWRHTWPPSQPQTMVFWPSQPSKINWF